MQSQKDDVMFSVSDIFRVKSDLDHKFMTFDGWKEVKDLSIEQDLIGIKPVIKELSNIINNNFLLFYSLIHF